jgi:hypothetical protein
MITNKPMSKELSLNLSERLSGVKLLNEFKGGLDVLAVLLEDVKKISIKEEEWAAAELKKTKNADETETWNWKDEGSEKALDLQAETLKYLSEKIKAKSDAGELSLSDSAMLALDKKLKA